MTVSSYEREVLVVSVRDSGTRSVFFVQVSAECLTSPIHVLGSSRSARKVNLITKIWKRTLGLLPGHSKGAATP